MDKLLDKIGTIIVVAMLVIFVLYKLAMVIAAHWFISAIIIGAITFNFLGQKVELALAAAILSAVVLFIFSPSDSDRNDWGQQIQEQRQEQERQERREQERRERERQEQERREAQERQNRERLEAQERQERERREAQERQERERREAQERQEAQRQEEQRREQAKSNEYNKIFTSYYQSISEHRFFEAYSLLSEKEKQHQGSLESFAEGRKDVVSIDILNFKVSDEKENMVVADYRIRTKDKNGNGFLISTFDGNVTFVKSSGNWKIDALSSKKIESHKE